MFMTTCGGQSGCESITLDEIKKSGQSCDGCQKAAVFIEALGEDMEQLLTDGEVSKAMDKAAHSWEEMLKERRRAEEEEKRLAGFIEAVKAWEEEQALRACDMDHDPDDWAPCIGGRDTLCEILQECGVSGIEVRV